MVSVLVIDDHPAVRLGVRAMLESFQDISVVGEAATAADGILLCNKLGPDVALVDLRLGDDDGVALIAKIAEQARRTRSLVLTTYKGDEAIHRALEAGAKGYILKSSHAREVELAVRAVAAGRHFIPEEIARELFESGGRVTLTPRERDVLPLVAEGLRNKQIAARLSMGEATVRTHVQSIMEKFGCHDRGAAIALAMARGFLTGTRSQTAV